MARIWLGVTDTRWFRFLFSKDLDEVNFWQPSSNVGFRALSPGDLFLFKLKKPHNHIGGGGYFLKYSRLPMSLAWEAFQEKNGAASFYKMREMILALREDKEESDPSIGCIILTAPFFFPEELWIDAPPDWSPNLVRGKIYSTETREGAQILDRVRERLAQGYMTVEDPMRIQEGASRYGKEIVNLFVRPIGRRTRAPQAAMGSGVGTGERALVADAGMGRRELNGAEKR